jgi:ubiquinone/menaquinone biosynthesis C-methylase UbiE
MGFYDDHVLPHVINLAMRNRDLLPYRKRALAAAGGRVLEIGVGSGLNLRFYPTGVRDIVGLEPAPRLAEMARHAAAGLSIPATFIEGSAESIPLDSHSVDTVVTTWTLCSIPDVATALREMRRVLKPDGQLLFVEHGEAPEERVQKWQHRLTPIWKRIGGGCHLDRPIRALVEGGGFAITHLATGYMRGPKPMTFMYEGHARPAQVSRDALARSLLPQ